jgi:Na+/proline symporter
MPLVATIGPVDYAVLAAYLAAMLAIGFYFSKTQNTTQEFFLASRSLGWFPLGMSLMATLISALSYTGIPGQGYLVGLKCLLMPLSVWLILPVIVGYVLPVFRGLGLYSIYEYLELRFDAATRLAATVLFAVWRLMWLGGVIYAPCKALLIAADWNVPEWPLLVGLGLVTTLYTFLGGMKAVVWTDVIQAIVMLGGVAIVIFSVWVNLDGGALRVAEVSAGLGRLQFIDSGFSFGQRWNVWGFLPHYVLAMLSFYIADQITAQRFLSAESVDAARTSFILNCGAITLLMPGLMYIGMCLLAFYYDHPEELRPEWVANVNHQAGYQPYADRQDPSRPLLDWHRRENAITPDNVEALVAAGKLIRPNTEGESFTRASDLIDPATGEIDLDKLATRKPSQGKLRGEIVLNRGLIEELLPRYVANQLPMGIAGLILAALLAASMSSIDSGLNSICTLLIMDFHRRYGIGRAWLAKKIGKPEESLTEDDELLLARPLTLVVGVAATVAALFLAQVRDIFDIMIGVANTFGAPLLAVFLLGMFTRRCTGVAAFCSLILGTLFTVGISLIYRFEALAPLRPTRFKIDDVWMVTFGTAFTLVVGYLLSFFLGRPKSVRELRGLVAGCGRLGMRAVDEELPLIAEPSVETRWKR